MDPILARLLAGFALLALVLAGMTVPDLFEQTTTPTQTGVHYR